MGPRGQLFDDATMSFGDHLEELRKRILWAVGPALPLAIVLFFFSNEFIRIMVGPLIRVLRNNDLPPEIQALDPPEVLIMKLKLSVIFAAVILAPWILFQAWLFIKPGLYQTERRFVHFLVPGSAVLTLAAIALLYYAMLPLVLQVMVSIGNNLDLGPPLVEVDPRITEAMEGAETVAVRPDEPDPLVAGQVWLHVPEMELRAAVAEDDGAVAVMVVPRQYRAMVSQSYRITSYINFVLLLLVGLVIAFQMPLVIVLLGWVGLATPDWLAKNRKYALFVCGILSAFLTPADVVSMLVLLIPLYFLYELGILLLRIAPASAVAEGSIIDRIKPDHRAAHEGTAHTDGPARAGESSPSGGDAPGGKSQTSSDATDGEDGPS
jgi:sec-independent protein translocase protein TatC